jgi:hypothetical protein
VLKRGRLLDSLRMWRPRKPLPVVVAVACPLADAGVEDEVPIPQDCEEPPDERTPEAGLDRPLGEYRPGLDHPPPRAGEGLRESDMGALGVPEVGVSKDRSFDLLCSSIA